MNAAELGYVPLSTLGDHDATLGEGRTSGHLVLAAGEAESPKSKRLRTPGRRLKAFYVRLVRRWVVDPGDPHWGPWVDFWETVLSVALLGVAVVTPFDLAFCHTITMPGILAADKVIDLIFGLNMVLSFLLAYPDPRRPAKYVKAPEAIFFAYLTGWFVPDLLAIMPVEFISALLRTNVADGKGQIHQSVRFMRLIRFARMKNVFDRWSTSFGFSYAKLTLMRFFVMTILICHVTACLWGGVGLYLRSTGEPNWLDALAHAKGGEEGMYDDMVFVYTIALYWAIVTLTSIGYGDITPQSNLEYCMTCGTMATTSATWAYVIGSVCSIVSELNPHELQFRRSLDDLNMMLHDRKMPTSMCRLFRRYFQEARDMGKERVEKSIITQMSPMLQGECAMFLHQEGIGKVWYLRGLEPAVIVWVARHLILSIHAPDETITDPRTMFIVRAGVCSLQGSVLVAGSVWGEDMILASDVLRHRAAVRALSFVSVLRLHIADLISVVAPLPVAREKLRFAQIRLAIQRAIVLIASAFRQLKRYHGIDTKTLPDEHRARLIRDILTEDLPYPLSEADTDDLRPYLPESQSADGSEHDRDGSPEDPSNQKFAESGEEVADGGLPSASSLDLPGEGDATANLLRDVLRDLGELRTRVKDLNARAAGQGGSIAMGSGAARQTSAGSGLTRQGPPGPGQGGSAASRGSPNRPKTRPRPPQQTSEQDTTWWVVKRLGMSRGTLHFP